MDSTEKIRTGLVLSGGVALGAYQAGVIQGLGAAGRLAFEAVAGASIGAYGAAVFAGNPPQERVGRLLEFWARATKESLMAGAAPPWPFPNGVRAKSWAHALAARMQGVPGLFRPLPRLGSDGGGPGLYDSSIAERTLRDLVDFDRLNAGDMRCCIGTTDIETGEAVWFDTAEGARLSPDHVRASGSLIPAFPPLRVDGRLLVDGGLSANAPLEPLLSATRPVAAPPLVVLIDLFPAAAPAPRSLEASQERSNDIMYAAQTRVRLAGIVRERALEARLDPQAPGTDVILLSYQAGPDEAGPEKAFDFSRAAFDRRFQAGERDARAALALLDRLPAPGATGVRVHVPAADGN
ncbi:MAG: patatin-like phospholipase family protein [Pseudomonadota bacterium]